MFLGACLSVCHRWVSSLCQPVCPQSAACPPESFCGLSLLSWLSVCSHLLREMLPDTGGAVLPKVGHPSQVHTSVIGSILLSGLWKGIKAEQGG